MPLSAQGTGEQPENTRARPNIVVKGRNGLEKIPAQHPSRFIRTYERVDHLRITTLRLDGDQPVAHETVDYQAPRSH